MPSTPLPLSPEPQVVVAYGRSCRAPSRDPPRGTLNVHSSLLPAYRGAAPSSSDVNGETVTGVTTMLLDEGLDTGPVLLARSTPIGQETAEELAPRWRIWAPGSSGR